LLLKNNETPHSADAPFGMTLPFVIGEEVKSSGRAGAFHCHLCQHATSTSFYDYQTIKKRKNVNFKKKKFFCFSFKICCIFAESFY